MWGSDSAGPDGPSGWAVGRASVTGPSHVKAGVPCQDSSAVHVDGQRLVAAVCDGAGSSAKSDTGARLAAQAVVDHLKDAAVSFAEEERQTLEGHFQAAVRAARAAIARELERGERGADYQATLVGVIADDTGGALFHIGDGFGLASVPAPGEDEHGMPGIHYWQQLAISWPDNGEYANETFFLTETHWQQQLRITPLIQPPGLVVLLSDGPAPFVVQQGVPNNRFIDVVVNQCQRLGGDDERDAYLEKVLSSPRADPITRDDKTLLVALRGEWLQEDWRHASAIAGSPEFSLAASASQAATGD